MQTFTVKRKQASANPVKAFGPTNVKVRNILRGRVQPKLKIGAVNDPAEIEADRVADQVMRMPTPTPVSADSSSPGGDRTGDSGENSNVSDSPRVQRKCTECADEKIQRKPAVHTPPVIRRHAAASDTRDSSASPHASSAINSLGSGFPLPSSERSFFEPRFGRDLSAVRIHTGGTADAASKLINARAFSLGNNIAFANGEYRPGTQTGRSLMAHEITHTVQQGRHAPRIQRAEIDDDPTLCQQLQDVTPRLDAHVNAVLSQARTRQSRGTMVPSYELRDGAGRVAAVYDQLGRGSPYSPIEDWAENLPDTYQRRVLIRGTRFRDTSNPFLLISGAPFGNRQGSGLVNPWMLKGERTLGTLLKVGDQCIGSDKLGHFFQQGRDYFHISVTLGRGDAFAHGFGEWLEGIMPSDPNIVSWINQMNNASWPGFDRLAYNVPFWQGVYGLSTTGVFSRADLSANEAGMEFYKRVNASPDVTFSSQAYINGQWNERINPSCFGPTMARLIAVNDPNFQRSAGPAMRAARRRYLQRANNTRQGISLVGQDELRATMQRLLAPYVQQYLC